MMLFNLNCHSMYSKQDIINSFAWESVILKHLASKIPSDKYDRKPTEGSRTIRELLEYMWRMGTTSIEIIKNWYNPETMQSMKIAIEARNIESEFETIIDEQLQIITDYLHSSTDDHLNEIVEIFGNSQARKQLLLEMALKNFPAYRMQLFQYLKVGLGLKDLKTSNLWMWKDS